MTELDRRAKNVFEIRGTDIEKRHYKYIIVGILDPNTRQHTIEYQAESRSANELQVNVFGFCRIGSAKQQMPNPSQHHHAMFRGTPRRLR